MPESLHSTEAKAIANAQTEIGKALTDKWLQGEDIVHKIVGELGILVIDHNITSAPKLTDYLLSLPKESYTPVWLDIYDLLDAQNKEGNGQKVRRLVSIARLAGMDRAVDPRVKQMLIDYENKYPEPETVKQLSLKEKIEQSLLSETTGNSTSIAFSPDELAKFMNEYKEPRGKFSFEDITAAIENGQLKLAGNAITADKQKIDISDASLLTVDERMIAALFKTTGWTTNFSVGGNHLVLNFSKPEPELAPPPAVPPPEPAAPDPAGTQLETVLDEQGITMYGQPWDQQFGELSPYDARSFLSSAYISQKHPGIVVEVFHNRPDITDHYDEELTVLQRLQGSPYVTQLKGYSHPLKTPTTDRYIVKELSEGEDMYQKLRNCKGSFPMDKGENHTNNYSQQRDLAAWFVSVLEALEDFDRRGVIVSHFIDSDCLWDNNKKRVVFDRLHSANLVEDLIGFRSPKSERSLGIDKLLRTFFATFRLGRSLMTMPLNEWKPQALDQIEGIAKEQGACASLLRIISLYKDMRNNIFQPTVNQFHSAGEFAEALWAYFHEVGLYDGPMPAPRVEKPADIPAPVPAPEPASNPEDEIKEKEVEIGIGDFLQARDTYLTFLKVYDKRAYDAFMEVCNGLLKTQAKAYSKDHPLATLYGDADLAIPLGVKQIESYLEKNPFEKMRINNRRVDHRMWKKERAFIRNPFEPKMWEVMKRVSRKITPQLVQNKLQEDPLAVLTIDPVWHSFMPEDDQLTNMHNIIIEAAGTITVDQVKELLNQHPETILRFTHSYIDYLPEEVNNYLGKFAKKVRFKLRPEDTQIPPAQGEIHLDTEKGVSLNIGPSANV